MNTNYSPISKPQNLETDSYAQLYPEKIIVLHHKHLEIGKMGITPTAIRILFELIDLARKAKTVSQSYIAKEINVRRETVSRHISLMDRIGYIESFYNNPDDSCLSYRINYDNILCFLRDGFMNQFKNIYFDLTQWVCDSITHIKTLHSSLINNKYSTKSKNHAKTEEPAKKVETEVKRESTVPLNIEPREKQPPVGLKPALFGKFIEGKLKSMGARMVSSGKKINGYFGKKKKPQSSGYSQSEAEKLLESIGKQSKRVENEIPIYEKHNQKNHSPRNQHQHVPEKKLNQPKEPPVFFSKEERRCIRELKERYGADDYTATIAMRNAKLNKKLYSPLKQVVSSEKAFQVNLDQGLKRKEAMIEKEKLKRSKESGSIVDQFFAISKD